MFTYPEMMLMQAAERRQEMEEQARHARLAAVLRRNRRFRDNEAAPAGTTPARTGSPAAGGRPGRTGRKAAVRGQPAGTLAACAANGASAR